MSPESQYYYERHNGQDFLAELRARNLPNTFIDNLSKCIAARYVELRWQRRPHEESVERAVHEYGGGIKQFYPDLSDKLDEFGEKVCRPYADALDDD
ncbi:MAG: hypothetical protein ACREGJ_02100 [Candidatus Saccharimonadales bacterium]